MIGMYFHYSPCSRRTERPAAGKWTVVATILIRHSRLQPAIIGRNVSNPVRPEINLKLRQVLLAPLDGTVFLNHFVAGFPAGEKLA